MKKRLLSIFCFIAILQAITLPVFATNSNSDDLHTIASRTIQCTTYTDDSGANISEYTQLDEFIDEVHLNCPSISDHDIAIFLCKYTGQDYTAIPDDRINKILQYDNLTSSAQYIGFAEDGTPFLSSDEAFPLDVWNSTDGYMRIYTNYSLIDTIRGENYYDVWATATWLKYPHVYDLEDAFVIGTNGTFDDDSEEIGRVTQKFTCKSCGRKMNYTRLVDRYSTSDDDLTLDYENHIPVLHFNPILPECASCDGSVTQTEFSAYISYSLITNGSKNIQSSYAHTTVGYTGIDISIGIDGAPSFSSGIASVIKTYPARALTLA